MVTPGASIHSACQGTSCSECLEPESEHQIQGEIFFPTTDNFRLRRNADAWVRRIRSANTDGIVSYNDGLVPCSLHHRSLSVSAGKGIAERCGLQ